MASCGGTCDFNCGSKEVEEETRERVGRISLAAASAAANAARCSKCGDGDAREGCNGACTACFRAYLFGKFKLAVTSNAMIAPTDNLLVAFSGGPASRVALQFIHEMQSKLVKSWDASNSQALPVFGVGVAFIDESIFSLKQSHEIEKAIENVQLIVSSISSVYKGIHIKPIENICSSDSKDGRSRLSELLDMITDNTGKEDFLQYLRMLSLQKIALENGYSKLILGSCTSAIACHVISATVKGQGYSLPADVHYVDTRWEVPVVLPLRDCLAQELSLLCHLDSLKTQQLLDRPSAGINGLVSSFVTRLREENPSRERTIVRTAEKLKPFCFNKFSANGYHDFLPSRLRPKFQNADNSDSVLSEVLCPICGSPLSEIELHNMRSTEGEARTRAEIFFTHCCQSCCFQILPNGAAAYEKFFSLLPQLMMRRVKDGMLANRSQLREEIKDYLLDDQDDDT
ncbi:cytoplasmic tRNA 2-thiolation protein 2 [Ananas comosus]|uniref:Cytoplasmic tRNA 2-thiolation protein 2 n=1 Tax=Ananas comosus TaxID=4615 RepID=A0A6P5FBQ5_ANACO|nr:cytoplasmic tRNA 2-thiolation protein 2 [Ananas comosus]